MQGTQVRSLVQEDPNAAEKLSPHANCWASSSSRAQELQILKTLCLEPVLCNRRGYHNEKHAHVNFKWRSNFKFQKEIQPISPKGNQSWIFIGRTDAEAETPILWPPDAKNWLIGKDPDSGKDWRWEEKGMTEDEMVGWHHQLDGHEFEQAPGVGDGQGGLVCCSPWGCKQLDMTELLNWSNHQFHLPIASFMNTVCTMKNKNCRNGKAPSLTDIGNSCQKWNDGKQ